MPNNAGNTQSGSVSPDEADQLNKLRASLPKSFLEQYEKEPHSLSDLMKSDAIWKNNEICYLELNKRKARMKEQNQEVITWRKLMDDVLGSSVQRGKIPLLLAVEAGNQSMCRELLSAQTSEQLKVSHKK